MKRMLLVFLPALLLVSAGAVGPVKTIKMGKAPSFAALNPVQNVLYVTNFASDEVFVVDPAAHTVKSRFYAGFEPLGIAVSPDGDKIFVTNMGPGLVKVVNAKDFALLDDIKVGSTPSNVVVSPKGSMAFVTNFGKGKVGRVDFVDTTSHRVVAELEVGIRPLAAAVTSAGDSLYVVCGGSNEVYAIDVAAKKITQQIPVGITPDGVALSPDGNTLYVANSGSNDISVVDLIDNTEKKRVPVGKNPFSLAVGNNGRLVVVETGDSSVSVFNPDLQKAATIKVGKQPIDVCLSTDDRFAFVTLEKDNKLAVLALQ